MSRLTILCFILVLSFLSAPAQMLIKGRVVNAGTGEVIPGASVFISNSSKGTSTNSTGNFEINDIPTGKYDLVISSVGYETNVFSFTEKQLPLTLKVELQQKVKELANVTVEPYVEEGWDKWSKVFTDNFIGGSENAKKTRILNTEDLRFRYFKKSNRLIAYSDKPLQIENKGLGYNITYQLEEFEVKFSENRSFFLGYSLFKEMGRDRKGWIRNRKEALNGSLMHFLRCLYVDSLKQNGFELRRMERHKNTEKARVRALISAGMTNLVHRSNDVPANDPHLSTDSTEYYRKVLRQRDLIETYGTSILTADSVLLRKEGEYKLLAFENYLFITYKNEVEEEGYLRSHLESRKATWQTSFLVLPDLNAVWIDRSGNYFNPADMLTMGYWGWSDKMGDCLPSDYEQEDN
jgi:hypothetical protein